MTHSAEVGGSQKSLLKRDLASVYFADGVFTGPRRLTQTNHYPTYQMTIDATVRISWNALNDTVNRFMEDAFNRHDPFAYISCVCPESADERCDVWGVPFEPRMVTDAEVGFVEFDIALGAPTEIFLALATDAPDNSNFRMLCLTDEDGLSASGYFVGTDGALREVTSPPEFNGTVDDLWLAIEGANNRMAELEAEGALVA